jgi:tetratricopeptide (TPR) repeat protein
MTDRPAEEPRGSRDGRVVTFYSFKGGTGRTMALANVAWILAANGHRVLAADWDLESPGLDRFFQPFFVDKEARDAAGIIDLIRAYERTAMQTDPGERAGIYGPHARVHQYSFSLNWDFPDGGCLDYLSPGKMNLDYVASLTAMDWDSFYQTLDGGEFLDALRADMKRNYDYVLIDSRTGFSDISQICTVHLPDVLVDCFTLSTQGIEGAAEVAARVRKRKDRPIRLLPVPMRVDQAEKKKVDDGRLVAIRHFPGLPEDMTDAQRREYWASVEIPYQAFYAYEETLAVFGDKPELPGSLLAAFERLTARITDGAVTSLPLMDEQIRLRTADMFTRRGPVAGELIVVESLAEDQAWAEWIAAVLRDAGLEVRHQALDSADPGLAADEDPVGEAEASLPKYSRSLVLVSAAYVSRRRVLTPRLGKADLAVYVTPSSSLMEFTTASAVSLSGVQEAEAIERLRRLLGLSGRPPAESSAGALRYPGVEPRIFEAPARNAQFTGRAANLGELRERLGESVASGVAQIVLQGLGGVGKTQVATEYVQRFRTDYDLVWWIDCAESAFIDASLADLGERMRTVFGLNVVPSANAADVTRQVLDLLSRGSLRWLLVFDNADEVDAIRPFVPAGGGHVLITSRNRAWSESGARLLPVDVFTRPESVTHLRQRVTSIARGEADQIASALGDLPLAVATTGALLAESAYTVSSFLEELERQPDRTLTSIGLLSDHPERVSRAWDVSLNRLREQSPAATRLLELCSITAPRVSLNLIYTPEMASLLEPFDAKLKDKMVIARVVQEINRLALIKLDRGVGELAVHVLVQEVVRDRMGGRLLEARRDVHRILVAARPRRDVDDPETWPRYRLIWPHLEASRAMRSDEEAVRQLYVDRVRYIYIRGDLERGRRLARDVEAAWMELEEAADAAAAQVLHEQLLQLRFNLGNVLRAQGRIDEARELNEGVLREQQDSLGPDHPHTLMTAGSLAADLRVVGRYREALEMDQRTYQAWTDIYGEDYPRTLSAANNLGLSLRLNGATTDAMRQNADTYERRRVTLGPRHRQTLESARSVAWDMLEAGEYAEAVVQVQDAYRTAAEILGADDRISLDLQMLLGIAMRSTGHAADAEIHFDAALTGLGKRGYDQSSSEVLACRLSQATNMLLLDRFAAAAAEVRQVLVVYEERLGPEHPYTLACLLNLGAALRYGDELDEAMRTIRRAVDGFTVTLGAEHRYTLAAEMCEGVLHAVRGELEAAELIESAAADTMARVLGPAHPDTLRCRANLLLTRHERGDHTAIGYRAGVIDQLSAMIGEEHPTIVTLRAERRLMRSIDPEAF